MLRIRQKQMRALCTYGLRKYEERILEHLQDHFPGQCEALSQDRIREAIRFGVNKARSYGFESEGEIGWYIDLMFIFGREFDGDPRLPWAAEILNDDAYLVPSLKVAALQEAVEEHEHLVTGLQGPPDMPRVQHG